MTEQHVKVIEQLATAALQSGVIRDLQSAGAVNDAINALRIFYSESLNLPVTGKPVIYNGNKESGNPEESGNRKESGNPENSGKENRQKI